MAGRAFMMAQNETELEMMGGGTGWKRRFWYIFTLLATCIEPFVLALKKCAYYIPREQCDSLILASLRSRL
jgi:hypothetical protein